VTCLYCDESPVPHGRVYCGVCLIAVRAEIEQGLCELDDYLANWAAFSAWCAKRPQVYGAASG
jgi:hypothetical protein